MQTELTGPDLTSGVPIADIPEHSMLAGHADGEAVILVRRGDEVFALGGTCTHYSAPLADGIVAGDTIRCPWHHACFDLRTGDALRAPALTPIPAWNVERRGDVVFVTTKREPSPPPVAKTDVRSIGIVGGGAAGAAAAEMLRRRGFDGAITIISAEETLPVDRPNLSKDYLAGNAPEEWIPLRTPEFYAEQNIEMVTGHRVLRVDAETKTLALDNGIERRFDAILIATGADPVRLTPPGAERVHVLRTLADSRAIIAEAEKGRRAVVLGASFIGLEVAAALRAREVDVTIVAPEEIPLVRILGTEVGAFIRALHEEHGVRFRLGATAAKFESDRVILSTGEPLPADFIVAGVGVRPNTLLGQIAGLKLDQGIVVDEHFETSACGIYAAGDVAKYPDRVSGKMIRVEHWAVAEQQGQTAACNIIGIETPHVAPPFFWSAHYDVTIAVVGHAAGFDKAELHGSLANRRALIAYRSGNEVAAVATIGMDREALRASVAMERGDRAELEAIVLL